MSDINSTKLRAGGPLSGAAVHLKNYVKEVIRRMLPSELRFTRVNQHQATHPMTSRRQHTFNKFIISS
jgi:hypothetical protein